MTWQISGERYVAFFDVMGFKNIAVSHPADAYALLRSFHDAASEAERLTQSIRRSHKPGTLLLSTDPESDSPLVRVIHFSDSTVAITRDASDESSLGIELVCTKVFLHC